MLLHNCTLLFLLPFSVSSRFVSFRFVPFRAFHCSSSRQSPCSFRGNGARDRLSLRRHVQEKQLEGGTKSESHREKDREREAEIFGYAQPTRQDRILARSARAPASPTRRFQLLLSALTQRSPLLLGT